MSRSWWRARSHGRFAHLCKGGCGGYLKAKGVHCYGCMVDLMGGLPPGSWRKREKQKRASSIPRDEVEKTALWV